MIIAHDVGCNMSQLLYLQCDPRVTPEIFIDFEKAVQAVAMIGVPEGIRTHGLKIRNLALYPAELREP